MREAPRHPLIHTRAVLAAAAAGRLVARCHSLPFDETVARLRRGAPFADHLADPLLHLRVVSRLVTWLPPRRMGRCMRRSLILLHLWSRCGLTPTLHLGVARGDEDRWRTHAWLTADHGSETLAAGAADGTTEAFTF